MPYLLKDLVIDRVDLVDEGANSAAFIELYKRKENSELMDIKEILAKMKPEHAEVINTALEDAEAKLAKANKDLTDANQKLTDKDTELSAANDALAKANEELETLKAKDKVCECDGELGEDGKCKECGGTKKSASFDETELVKSMPEQARALYLKMRTQKEAAEEQVRKNAEAQAEADAIAKAASLKAIPVEQATLVGILKGCSPDVLSVLTAANDAIEAAVLGEVGKNKGNGASTEAADAWSDIEKAAEAIQKRDSVTKEKAISLAISENPELYKQYLEGGAR
jgi:hypothetical protein